MIEYRTAIVDECGDVVMWCEDMDQDEIEEILEDHIEWRMRCICMGGDY